MASTRARITLTSSAWTSIAVGAIATGTISSETQSIRVSIQTAGAPSSLKQGHLLYSREGWGFILDAGETLWAIADNVDTSAIATY